MHFLSTDSKRPYLQSFIEVNTDIPLQVGEWLDLHIHIVSPSQHDEDEIIPLGNYEEPPCASMGVVINSVLVYSSLESMPYEPHVAPSSYNQ